MDVFNKELSDSSVFFTGVYGYAIGVLWLLCGMVCGFFLLTINFCCQSDGGRRTKKILPFYVGSSKFHSQARTSVNVIIKIADDASEIIHNVTRALEDLVESGISAEVSENLNSSAKKMDNCKNFRSLIFILQKMFIITILIISLNLVAVPILSYYSHNMLEFSVEQFLEYTCFGGHFTCRFVILCWLMTLRSAKSILHEVSAGISIFVNEVNSNLGSLFPNHVYLCNPSYQPEFCPLNSIQIGDIPMVLKPYTCFDDSDEKCGSDDLMNGGEYKVVEAYSRCHLVKDAFSQVLLKHCKPLKKFARMARDEMVFLAVMMVFYVVLWTIKSCQDHSSYHPSDDSV
ncbi:hypothetical protein GYH30_030856 [Glycine max]|uniref:Uncharacterized protein n=2 Tax=Glycine subgen. Soja TaxID=1462606 RepID=A0A0R0HTK3_SOYBN|nr:hypothetical protein GYH30_030856 [Glycine max]RZB79644.1 hypothetical protein D0Y65_029755 [Glycine soja]